MASLDSSCNQVDCLFAVASFQGPFIDDPFVQKMELTGMTGHVYDLMGTFVGTSASRSSSTPTPRPRRALIEEVVVNNPRSRQPSRAALEAIPDKDIPPGRCYTAEHCLTFDNISVRNLAFANIDEYCSESGPGEETASLAFAFLVDGDDQARVAAGREREMKCQRFVRSGAKAQKEGAATDVGRHAVEGPAEISIGGPR